MEGYEFLQLLEEAYNVNATVKKLVESAEETVRKGHEGVFSV
jgi:hypothetical protein